MGRNYFGTDGIRGEAGKFPLTPDFVMRIGQSAGRYFARHSQRPVVLIAKDTRQSGDMLEAALAAGLLSQGVRVEHLGVLPTPAAAYLTDLLEATAGIVISASHNPYRDNGIKFFGPGGEKLSDDAESAIEDGLHEEYQSTAIATVSNHREAERLYIDRLIALGPRLEGLKLVLDTANGATYRVAVRAFQGLGAEVFAICNTPDGKNINRGCGSTHPRLLARTVLENSADMGIAFDGDGDRVILVDARGRVVDGDRLLYINALVRREKAVVGTLMSNLALQRALEAEGIEFIRTAVGDRYVYQEMRKRNLRLGGEQSGHILFLDHLQTGDGIQTALLTLDSLLRSDLSLEEWVDRLQMYPQLLRNVEVADKEALMNNPQLSQWLAEAQRMLPQGRINVRPSGTEPLLRIMVEGPDENDVIKVADWLEGLIKNAAAQIS